MTTAHDSAQIALGKFYLHRWEGQVLVDWAVSVLEQGQEHPQLVRLAQLEGATRSQQLDQFIRACSAVGIPVLENIERSVRAYCEDLRRRALAGEITLEAAFAQLRPLAYDTSSVVIPGLEELDEDLNLLDSEQPAFHHSDLVTDNKEHYLRRFFENLLVEDSFTAPPRPAREIGTNLPPQPEADFARYVELTAVILITLLFVIYVLLLFAGFVAQVDLMTLY